MTLYFIYDVLGKIRQDILLVKAATTSDSTADRKGTSTSTSTSKDPAEPSTYTLNPLFPADIDDNVDDDQQ